jgi:GDP-L-fucose synthase
MEKKSRILVAGSGGILGSALVRRLSGEGYSLLAPSKKDLDLLNTLDVNRFFYSHAPDYVFLAAAKVGSISDNIIYPVNFISENIKIQQNVIEASHRIGVKKLLFFGANCMYPRECPQPIREEYLLTGQLEPTNEAYALAKIAGIKLCRSYNLQYGTNFRSIVPASLYGPNDHFGTPKAHVIADMIEKFHKAKEMGKNEITFWGDGSPFREYLFADDAAEAAIFFMNLESFPEIGYLNAGTGQEISIFNLAHLIGKIVGYPGDIKWDTSRPNGMPRKLLNSFKANSLGWSHKISLGEGIKKTYEWYLEQEDKWKRNSAYP